MALNPDTVPEPIIVNGKSLPAGIAAAARYLIAMVLTFAVGRGWVAADQVEGVIAIVIAAATAAWGVGSTVQRQGQLAITAKAAPDEVAEVV